MARTKPEIPLDDMAPRARKNELARRRFDNELKRLASMDRNELFSEFENYHSSWVYVGHELYGPRTISNWESIAADPSFQGRSMPWSIYYKGKRYDALTIAGVLDAVRQNPYVFGSNVDVVETEKQNYKYDGRRSLEKLPRPEHLLMREIVSMMSVGVLGMIDWKSMRVILYTVGEWRMWAAGFHDALVERLGERERLIRGRELMEGEDE